MLVEKLFDYVLKVEEFLLWFRCLEFVRELFFERIGIEEVEDDLL